MKSSTDEMVISCMNYGENTMAMNLSPINESFCVQSTKNWYQRK